MMKKILAVVVALILGASLGLIAFSGAEARYADPTTSEGRYVGEIDWIEWGVHGTEVGDGTESIPSSRVVDGQTLEVGCELTDPITGGTLVAWNPGSGFWPTAFDNMYNIPNDGTDGLGSNNNLVAGLRAQGGPVTSSFTCGATLDGETVPLSGLVFADAEQSGNSTEYVEASPTGSFTGWSLIDGYATDDCTSTQSLSRTSDTLRITGGGACTDGPGFVAFMEGTDSATFSVLGGGASAIALGVVLPVDFGDAPEAYGEAGALYSPTFSGGETLDDGADLSLSPHTADYASQATELRLGEEIEADSDYQASTAADADAVGDDGVTVPAGGLTATVEVGQTYTVNVACSGSGVVRGWLDWNVSNGFDDASDASDPVSCTDGTAALTWTIPADAPTNLIDEETAASFLRVRLVATDDVDQLDSPTGLSTSGEVEDYPISLVNAANPELTLDKSATLHDDNGNGTADVGEEIDYSFLVSNTGNQTVRDVTVTDPQVTGLDPETVAELAPGDSVTFTADPYTVTAADVASGSVLNTATASGTTEVGDIEIAAEDSVTTVTTPVSVADLPSTGSSFTQSLLWVAALSAVGGTLVLRFRRRAGATA
ncbi:MAG: CshA/CshB family fibrillar adhesin-related protein [Aeromicrobium sp.]|uniref:CshA/CshB family fibrillar adhesin-related protein n=1 Tax=Aeromicrobium sp. TaxID=1871063 RepID=UPI0039E5F754